MACKGDCCEDALFFIRKDGDTWYLQDGNWERVVMISFCPFCGGPLEE